MNFLSLILFWRLFDFCNIDENYLRLSDQLQRKFAIEAKEKYGLREMATHGKLSKNIGSLGIHFQHTGFMSKEELRRVLVDLTNLYLERINNNPKIKKFMYRHPFTTEDIDIKIFIIDPEKKKVVDPNIAVAASTYGDIVFYTKQEESLAFKRKEKETFEEAAAIVQSNQG